MVSGINILSIVDTIAKKKTLTVPDRGLDLPLWFEQKQCNRPCLQRPEGHRCPILWDISWYECPLRGFPDCTQPKTDHVDEMKTKKN